jgi:predicted ribosome quality control (RQC) complex YloA/Tae2 family protein
MKAVKSVTYEHNVTYNMVFFFETNEGYVIYMGTDKYENEDLIKYGLPEDIWFHVEDLSSAHVYLRLRKDQKLEDVKIINPN